MARMGPSWSTGHCRGLVRRWARWARGEALIPELHWSLGSGGARRTRPLVDVVQGAHMSKRSVLARARPFGVAVAIAGVVVALLPGAAASAGPGDPGPPATFTTTNGDADGGYFCINGPAAQDPVNCNLYERKEHVWLNGGPDLAHLGDGDYFFVVLEPGGQNDGL